MDIHTSPFLNKQILLKKNERIKFTHKYLDATFSLENEPRLKNLRKIYKINIDLLLEVQMDKLGEIPYQL
jgi:hypothetical protein